MSTARGSSNRKRPQKHQNRTAFKNDLHDTSHKTKLLNSLEINGVCQRCKDILDWKIKYKKYKPLTAPRKCIGCEQKCVKYAYHMLCGNCAKEKKVCPKCVKSGVSEEQTEKLSEPSDNNAILKEMLKVLPERKRRTILRHISKTQDGNDQVSNEVLNKVEQMISSMDKLAFDDDDDDDDDFLGDEFDSEDDISEED